MFFALYMFMNSELVAIPVFQDRVSPLLDEARRFILFEVCDGEITQKIVINVDFDTCIMRITKLKELGVLTIISGAVSGYISGIIIENGLRHYPWNSGDVNEIIELYLKNRLQPCRASVNQCGEGRRRKRCEAIIRDGSLMQNNEKE